MKLSVKEAKVVLSNLSGEVEVLCGTVEELRNEMDGLKMRFETVEGYMGMSNGRIVGVP